MSDRASKGAFMATILCIEDEADLRADIVEDLQEAGYKTLEAGDGTTGLDLIVDREPDLVLCDITMPGLDGYAVLRRLREDHPDLADIPFLFLTARAGRQDIIAGKTLGADDYLVKPVDFEMLRATVQSRLRQVARMQAHKHAQMAALSRAMIARESAVVDADALPRIPANAGPLDPGDLMTVVTVINGEVDLDPVIEDLEAAGHCVFAVDSGAEFLAALQNVAADVVLMSYQTADLAAPAVMEALGRAPVRSAFPVILLLPPDMSDLPDPRHATLFDDVIRTPYDRQKLVEKVVSLATRGDDDGLQATA